MTDTEAGSRPDQPSIPASGSADSPPTGMPGSTERMVGEFRLLRRLGRGGMAEVYLAEQTSLNRQVAIKILRPELLADEVHVKRFEREAKAAAGLRHANIVQVYAVGAHAGVHFIAQEFVHGWNLKEYLEKKGPPDLPVALHLMKQIAAALAAAGEAGIVHRDIKPENILITRKGEVKVADFGLAQLAQPADPVTLTQVGITMGTPLYMSPEQVSGEKVDQRSDIYSFGVTCYRMLAGHPPFRGDTALAVAMQHLNKSPELLIDKRPDLPPILCQIVHKMMARHPADRYPDAPSILNDLRRASKLLKQQPDATGEISLTSIEPTPRAVAKTSGRRFVPRIFSASFLSWSLKKQLVVFAATALAVGGASAALGWWLRPPNPLDTTPPKLGGITKTATVAEQYFQAMRLNVDEDAWQAVIDNFPENTSENSQFRHLAEERLAWIHLQKRRFDRAESLYTELVSFGNEDERLKAVGLAGLAILANLKQDYKESQRIIQEHRPLLEQHLLGEMREYVLETIRRNQKQLRDDSSKGLEDYFRPEPAEPGSEPPPR